SQHAGYMLCQALASLIVGYLPLGMYDEARRALREGLDTVITIDSEPTKTNMLVAAVQTWFFAALAESDQNVQRELLGDAAIWSGLVLACPGARQESRDEIGKLRPQMEGLLGTEQFDGLLKQGGQLYLDGVIAEILTVLPED